MVLNWRFFGVELEVFGVELTDFVCWKGVVRVRVVNLRLDQLSRAVSARIFKWTGPGRAGQAKIIKWTFKLDNILENFYSEKHFYSEYLS